MPVAGRMAYPMQLLYGGGGHGGQLLGRFVMHDLGAALGRRLPVWGGRDTLLEHWLNRRLCPR
jgi:hypothetical protein